MRLLAVCASPPTRHPRHGDGSTHLASRLLELLPEDIEIDLVYFTHRPAGPPEPLARRCRTINPLPLAHHIMGVLTTLPRATRLRLTRRAKQVVATLGRDADVAYLHGINAFAFAPMLQQPVVVHEVDAMSMYWRERGEQRRFFGRAYDLLQARRVEALERATSRSASRYFVVSADDAKALGTLIERRVDVLPTGSDGLGLGGGATAGIAEPNLIGFVGSLSYAPNIQAVRTLADDLFPRVVRSIPDARLLVAGRQPAGEVRRLASSAIEVAGDVPDIGQAYARASVLVYPATFGRGKKTTIVEALAAGRPVVAAPSAARGIPAGDHIVIAPDVDTMAADVVRLLKDSEARAAMSRAALSYVSSLPSWQHLADRFAGILREVDRSSPS